MLFQIYKLKWFKINLLLLLNMADNMSDDEMFVTKRSGKIEIISF